jgi:hypothetical protein
MDINGFREAQSPWFFTQPPTYLVETRATAVVVPTKTTAPVQDNRFPGWAAPMEDGRLVTDYRSQCELNIPAGMQYATTRFMQRNASEIMEKARHRQSVIAGAGLPYDSVTEMPAAAYVNCDAFTCSVTRGVSNGVGLVRKEPVPELFGTFSRSRPSILEPAKPLGTRTEEGGRNTVRGVFTRE